MSDLISSSKLMFYPTDETETYRMLGLLGKIQIGYEKIKEIRSTLLTVEQDEKFKEIAINHDIDYDSILFDYWIHTKQYDLIKKYCTIRYAYRSDNEFVIADLFAGEGKWLDSFKSFVPITNIEPFLLANELESNRFDKISADVKYNAAFEELELPKHSISLMLFNPPYGSTNNIRNVRYYLKEIIDKKLISNNTYKTGKIIGVIRKDDFLDSLDIICQYFDINKNCIYKVNPTEYAKYKQFVFIGNIRSTPYNLELAYYAAQYKTEYDALQTIINSDPEFDYSMYDCHRRFIYDYPACDFSGLISDLNAAKQYANYISTDNKNWNWIKEISEVKDGSLQKLTIPLPPKTETLANIIASGYINGRIDKHIVVGGTKTITKTEVLDEKIKSVKLSKPYLNILYSHNNELKVKELIGDDE